MVWFHAGPDSVAWTAPTDAVRLVARHLVVLLRSVIDLRQIPGQTGDVRGGHDDAPPEERRLQRASHQMRRWEGLEGTYSVRAEGLLCSETIYTVNGCFLDAFVPIVEACPGRAYGCSKARSWLTLLAFHHVFWEQVTQD